MGLDGMLGAVAALTLAMMQFTGTAHTQAETGETDHLNAIFADAGETGAVLVRRLSDRAEWTGGDDRVDQRFLPASTFKIPNSLIILETGVVSDPDTDVLVWDGVERSSGWDQDQSLRTGLRRSAVWAYQHWAQQVGHDQMTTHVQGLDYGNSAIGRPEMLDRFWLEGPLQISAREQVNFLERLYAQALPIDVGVQAQVIDIMEHDRGEGWVLRAKTGWAIHGEPDIGWFVGWLETEDDVWLFALNMDLDFETGVGVMREHLARQALVAAGAPIEP